MNFIQNALSYIWPGSIVCISYLIIFEIIIQMRNEKVSWWHRIILFILGIYLTFIFSATVSPVYGYSLRIPNLVRVNLIPFHVFSTMFSNPLNFFGNILMFIPFGCLLVLLSKKCQNIYITIIAGAKLSILIEVLQLFGTRRTDIDDLLLNTIGTFLGYCLGKYILGAVPSIKLKIGILIKKTGKVRPNDTGSINIFISIILITVIITGFTKIESYSNTSEKENVINNADRSNPTQLKPPNNEYLPTLDVDLYAQNALLWDVKTDSIIYEKEISKQIAPASTAKMLTALTVLDYCDPDEEVVVGEEIYLIASDASRAWLSVGDRLTIEHLLDGLLLPSGSDAAYALAVYVGRKISANSNISIQEALTTFINLMNKKATSIDASNSNFKNPDGYDIENQYTTAYDLAHIAKEFIEVPLLYDIASKLRIRDVWINGKDVKYVNTNELINPDSLYYYEDAVGLKTGTTVYAGNCLVSAAKINGRIYICVIMDSTEEGRWLDSLALYHSIDQ